MCFWKPWWILWINLKIVLLKMYQFLTFLLFNLPCPPCGHTLIKHCLITFPDIFTLTNICWKLSPQHIFVWLNMAITFCELLQHSCIFCVNILYMQACMEISLFSSILAICLLIILLFWYFKPLRVEVILISVLLTVPAGHQHIINTCCITHLQKIWQNCMFNLI